MPFYKNSRRFMDTSPLKQKAEKCIKSQNFVLAQKIFLQILSADPKDVDVRKNLRAVNLKLLENNNGKVPFQLKTASLNVKLNLAGKNFEKIISLIDEILCIDPNNTKLLIKQGLAALELKYFDSAGFMLESASNSDPKAVEPLRHLSKMYEEKGGRDNLKKATQYANMMRDLEPRNKEIQDLARRLDAALAQLPFEKSFTEGLVSKEETEEREKEEQLIHTDKDAEHAIKQLTQKTLEDPNNPKTFEKLGDVLARLRKNKEAKEAYGKSLALNPANTLIQIKIGNIDINEIIWNIQKTKEKLDADPTNASLKESIHKLELEKYRFSVAEFEKRVETQPTVNSYKFELAKLYFQDKRKANEAIRLFQITCKEPTYRTDSLIYLGKLFVNSGDCDLGVDQFNEALKALAGFDNRKKDTLYSKADALEKLGKLDESKQTFQSIIVEDISYRDVSKRVDALKEKLK